MKIGHINSCKELVLYVSKTIKMKGVPFLSLFLQILDMMPSRRGGERLPFRVNPQILAGVVQSRSGDGGSQDNRSSPVQVADVGQSRSGSETHVDDTFREQVAQQAPSVERSPEPVVDQGASSTVVLDSAEAGPSGDGGVPLDEAVYRKILEGLEQYEWHVGGVRHELGALMKKVEELLEHSGELLLVEA